MWTRARRAAGLARNPVFTVASGSSATVFLPVKILGLGSRGGRNRNSSSGVSSITAPGSRQPVRYRKFGFLEKSVVQIFGFIGAEQNHDAVERLAQLGAARFVVVLRDAGGGASHAYQGERQASRARVSRMSRSIALLVTRYWGASWWPGPPQIDHQQPRADSDRRIGGIKGRKFVRSNKDLQKIRDGAGKQTVPQIAQRASEDQRQAGAQQNGVMHAGTLRPPQHHGDRGHHGQGHAHQKHAPPPAAGLREHAERRPRILNVDDVEYARDHRMNIQDREGAADV